MSKVHLREFDVTGMDVENGKTWVIVRPKKLPKRCYKCHSTELIKRGPYKRDILDVPGFEKNTAIRIKTHRMQCKACGKIFVPRYRFVDVHATISNDLKRQIRAECLSKSLTKLSAEYGFPPSTIKKITDPYIREKLEAWVTYIPELMGLISICIFGRNRLIVWDDYRAGIVDYLDDDSLQSIIAFLEGAKKTKNRVCYTTLDIDLSPLKSYGIYRIGLLEKEGPLTTRLQEYVKSFANANALSPEIIRARVLLSNKKSRQKAEAIDRFGNKTGEILGDYVQLGEL